MTINITDDSEHNLTLEDLVIKIFDGIKCAALLIINSDYI